jgi:hypothetical protein
VQEGAVGIAGGADGVRFWNGAKVFVSCPVAAWYGNGVGVCRQICTVGYSDLREFRLGGKYITLHIVFTLKGLRLKGGYIGKVFFKKDRFLVVGVGNARYLL